MKNLSSTQKAYIAGFLDGDGSIYVRMKPNSTYRYGFQIVPCIALFQSKKDQRRFEEICSLVKLGYVRERNDGMIEYTIAREAAIRSFLREVRPFLILKCEQADLMIQTLDAKLKVRNLDDFRALAKLVDTFRDLNYSKKRKAYIDPVET